MDEEAAGRRARGRVVRCNVGSMVSLRLANKKTTEVRATRIVTLFFPLSTVRDINSLAFAIRDSALARPVARVDVVHSGRTRRRVLNSLVTCSRVLTSRIHTLRLTLHADLRVSPRVCYAEQPQRILAFKPKVVEGLHL